MLEGGNKIKKDKNTVGTRSFTVVKLMSILYIYPHKGH